MLPTLPARPTLRPGIHVVRRDASTLQIGLDPPARVLAPDTDGVRRLLRDLRAAQAPESLTAEALACLTALLASGLVVAEGRCDLPAAQFGLDAETRVRARAAVSIGVRGPAALADRARTLLRGAGARASLDSKSPGVLLLLSEGEPVRESLDDLVRQGVAHLVVVSRGGTIELGPLVVPGRTACLRCVDAHHARHDPRRNLVVEQVARAVGAGAREPQDDVLWSLALAWAARDLLRYAEGDRPSTWSTSHLIGPGGAPTRREWQRHPHCGCAWDAC